MLYYESNPKHTEPWQRGRKGSLCPTTSMSFRTATKLLRKSDQIDKKRFICQATSKNDPLGDN